MYHQNENWGQNSVWMDDLLEYWSIMGHQLMMNHLDEFNLQLWPTFWYSNSGHCYIEFMLKNHITKLQKKFPYCFKQFYDFVLGHIQFSLVTYRFQWPVGFTLDMSGTINILGCRKKSHTDSVNFQPRNMELIIRTVVRIVCHFHQSSTALTACWVSIGLSLASSALLAWLTSCRSVGVYLPNSLTSVMRIKSDYATLGERIFPNVDKFVLFSCIPQE